LTSSDIFENFGEIELSPITLPSPSKAGERQGEGRLQNGNSYTIKLYRRAEMIKKYECFEDYEEGEKGVTRMRTVGEPEIVNFACITCDYSYVHLAHHATKDGPYGGRIAHGLLGTSMAVGLLSLDAPHLVGRDVPGSYLHAFEANYRDAIRLGDTIRIVWKIAEKKENVNDSSQGFIKTEFKVLNQDERAIYDGNFQIVVPRRSNEEKGKKASTMHTHSRWDVMEVVFDPEKVYYFDDFSPGEGGITSGRTITETDTVNFSGLTGDYNPLYVDEHHARKGPFGQRIVPPMLAFTMGFGLWTRDGEFVRSIGADPSTDAGHLHDSALFYQPLKIGDTIRCAYRVMEKRISRKKPQIGIITYGFQILNQKDEVVQEGKTLMMRGISRAG